MNMFSKKEIIAFFAALAFNVFLIIAFHDRDCTYFMLLVIALWCLAYLVLYLVRKNITQKCKHCGAKGSMRYLGKKSVGEKDIRKLKETDSTGRRVPPYYVYGRAITYKEARRCTKCGYTEYRSSVEEEWDDENIRP